MTNLANMLVDWKWCREKPVEAAEEIDRLRDAAAAAEATLSILEAVLDADDQPETWSMVNGVRKKLLLVLKRAVEITNNAEVER